MSVDNTTNKVSADIWKTSFIKFQQYRDNDFLCDTVLISKSTRRFKAHSLLLSAFSPIFEAIFQRDSKVGIHYVNLPMVEDCTLEVLLYFIYSGKLLVPLEFAQAGKLSPLLVALKNLGIDLGVLKNCAVELKRSEVIDSYDVSGKSSSENQRVSSSADRPAGSAISNAFVIQQNNSKEECVQIGNYDNLRTCSSLSGIEGVTNSRDCVVKNGLAGKSFDRPQPKLPQKDSAVDMNFESPSAINDQENRIDSDGVSTKYDCLFCGKRFYCTAELTSHKCYKLSGIIEEEFENFVKFSIDSSKGIVELKNGTSGKKCSKVKPRVVCHLCGLSLKFDSIRCHIESQHEKKKNYKCEDCDMSFNTYTRRYVHCLRMHQKRNLNGKENEFLCETCGRNFKNRISLYHHTYNKHRNNTKVSRPVLTIHSCADCSKTFRHKSSLKEHVIKNHPDSGRYLNPHPYVCQECGKCFVFKSSFRAHLARHRTEKLFGCNVCQKLFKTKNQAQSHARVTHTELRQYSCDLCGNSFKQRHHLAQHMVHHSDERPYACNLCEKSYKVKHDLKLHCKRVHQKIIGVPSSDIK